MFVPLTRKEDKIFAKNMIELTLEENQRWWTVLFHCRSNHLNWTLISSQTVGQANICKWFSDFFVVAWFRADRTHCKIGSQKFSIFSLLLTCHVTVNKSVCLGGGSVCWMFQTELTCSLESEWKAEAELECEGRGVWWC